MGDDIAGSLLGLGGGRSALSSDGVPIRAGFENIFILESFLAGGGV